MMGLSSSRPSAIPEKEMASIPRQESRLATARPPINGEILKRPSNNDENSTANAKITTISPPEDPSAAPLKDPPAQPHDASQLSAEIIPRSAPPLHSAQSDWHAEMLCGLFLRSDERELESLESSSSQRSPPQSLPQHERMSDMGGGGREAQEQFEKKSQQPTNYFLNDRKNNADPTTGFLMDMLHLGETMDSTVLSLVPGALRSLTSALTEEQHNRISKDDFDGNEKAGAPDSTAQSNATASAQNTPEIIDLLSNSSSNNDHIDLKENGNVGSNNDDEPLLVPSSWRRPDYVKRTLPELEQHLISLGKAGISDNNISRGEPRPPPPKNGKNGSHPTPSRPAKKGPKIYNLFTFLYNECSLSALANWTMLNFSPTNSNGPNNEADEKEKWERCKNEQEQRRNSHKGRYRVMVPQPIFHLCSVCSKFGHYEAECELLITNDTNWRKRGREESSGDEYPKMPSPKKTRAHVDVLDEKLKNAVISTLSKEVHVQRRQQYLYENYPMEKKKASPNNENIPNALRDQALPLAPPHSETPAALAAPALELGNGTTTAALVAPKIELANGSNREKKEGDENQYEGKSSCCSICRSGIDDGRMILCDGCDDLFHCKCLDPPLDSIPEGDWFCNKCINHDLDVSSIVEIEGCGDFVIEQRKHSVAEEARLYSGVSLGQSKSSWTTAVSLLPAQDPIVEDELYLQKHLGREYGHITEDFFPTELCWAKRFDSQLCRPEWWPGMVINSETRSLKSRKKTSYSVQFFVLGENSGIPEADILPFMPYYEDIGQKRLMRSDDSHRETFRHALMLCVSALGLKSLGQALNLARNGIQMAAKMKNDHKKILPAGWKIPFGWESAEIDKVDDIVILAKEGGSERTPPRKLKHEVIRMDTGGNGVGGLASNYCDLTIKTNENSNSDQDSYASHRMVAQFHIDEIVGSIVSWQPDFGDWYSSEKPHVKYGVVVSIDTAAERALVRAVPLLSEVTLGKLDALFHNDSNELLMQASNVGATIWIPLKHVRFVSGKPSKHKLAKFRRKLKSNMSHELESYSSQIKQEATHREEYTVELQDPLDRGQIPISTDSNTPTLTCPFCGFQSLRQCALSNHMRYCERQRSRQPG